MADPTIVTAVYQSLLIFIRISSLLLLLPGFTSGSLPPIAKIGVAIALSSIIGPIIYATILPMPDSIALIVVSIGGQIIVGLSAGWVINTVLMALPVAGQIISYQIGLSSVLLPNSEIGAESTLISTTFTLAIPVLVLTSPLIAVPILAIANSFKTIPIDYLTMRHQTGWLAFVMKTTVYVVQAEFALAIQIAAPFLVVGLVWQAGLGLMAKASPQMQVYFVSAPLQILIGLVMVVMLLSPMFSTWSVAVSQILAHYIRL